MRRRIAAVGLMLVVVACAAAPTPTPTAVTANPTVPPATQVATASLEATTAASTTPTTSPSATIPPATSKPTTSPSVAPSEPGRLRGDGFSVATQPGWVESAPSGSELTFIESADGVAMFYVVRDAEALDSLTMRGYAEETRTELAGLFPDEGTIADTQLPAGPATVLTFVNSLSGYMSSTVVYVLADGPAAWSLYLDTAAAEPDPSGLAIVRSFRFDTESRRQRGSNAADQPPGSSKGGYGCFVSWVARGIEPARRAQMSNPSWRIGWGPASKIDYSPSGPKTSFPASRTSNFPSMAIFIGMPTWDTVPSKGSRTVW